MKTAYSFDVFDTCLTRKFAAPSDLFLELANRLLRHSPALSARFDAETLWAARMEAEKSARRESACEEVTLEEIWRKLAARVDAPELVKLSSMELTLEEESLCPITSCLRDIEILRGQGDRILFISDIYLPGAFVKAQLYRHGFGRDGDSIYVSSHWGKTKATGNLFKAVLDEEKLTAHSLYHRGDDEGSDVEAPRRLGIRSSLVRYRHTTPEQASLLAIEGADYCVRSRLVGAMQTFRLHKEPTGSREAAPLLAGLLAPLVFGFASWVLAQAQRDGIRRLYFLARDCQMAYQVAKEISDQFGGIECRYLHVSRQALLLPAAHAISAEGMPWMRRAYETPSLERLLAKLELDYADVSTDWDARAGTKGGRYHLGNDDDWNLFWEALNREPLRSRLLARIQTRRQAAQAYFRAEGLFDATPWAVVDLGWYLSCQSALRQLLRSVDPKMEVQGYYLGLRRERFGPNEAGKATALFHQRSPDQSNGARKQPLFKHATLFEHVLGIADHSSLHHYEGSGVAARPVFQLPDKATSDIQLAQAIQTELRAFAAQNASLAPALGEPRVAAPVLSSLIESLAENPSSEIARALAVVQASEDQNNLHASSLAAPMGAGEMAAMWLPKRLRKVFGIAALPSVWMEGRLAVTPPYLRRLFALRKAIGGRTRWQSIPG